MQWSSYIDLYTKTVAFFSPKCACTAVDHWFAKGLLTLNPELEHQRVNAIEGIDFIEEGKPRIYLHTRGFRYSFPQSMRHVETNEYFVVHFTRHPATRLVSVFLNKFVNGRGQRLIEFSKLEPFAQDLVRRIYAINKWDTHPYKGIRFIDLVNFLHLAIAQTGFRGMPEIDYIDHHWNTQLPPHVRRGVHLTPNFVVHVETFDADIARLNTTLGVSFIPNRYNPSTFGGVETTSENLAGVFSLDLVKSDLVIRPHNLLSGPVIEALKQIYEVDFRYFGYLPSNISYVQSENNL
jgi:hypothetical protein